MNRNRLIFPLSLVIATAVHLLLLGQAQQYFYRYEWSLLREVERLKREHQSDPLLIQLELPLQLELGKEDGMGDAVNELDLPDEMAARQADQIQAPLSRDPASLSDPALLPKTAQPIPAPRSAPPPPPPLSHEIAQEDGAEPVLPAQPGRATDPAPPLSDADALFADATLAPVPQPVTPQPIADAGDPLPQADADSDPFHVHGSVTFHAGKVEAQFGRAIKPVRPKIRLAGRWDGVALQYPSVTLRIRTDEHGNVRAAEITQSSGSLNIDQPVLVAIYDWWFEPPKDANGNPRPDVFTFTLNFR